MILPVFMHCLQPSPGSVRYVFLVLVKWGLNEAYTILVGPSNRSLFLHKAPSVKSRSRSPHYFIKKMQLKSISSVISVVVLTDWCLCFNFSCILDTCILFLFLCFRHSTPGTKFCYILISHRLLWHVPSLFSWLVNGAHLPCLVVEMLREEGS